VADLVLVRCTASRSRDEFSLAQVFSASSAALVFRPSSKSLDDTHQSIVTAESSELRAVPLACPGRWERSLEWVTQKMADHRRRT